MNERLLSPDDDENRRLIANVHPPDWVNPEPIARYNLVVIGAGTAGLVTAVIAAGLGAKVALVERRLMGGDCLNVGCVPSKALLRSAQAWADLRRADAFGLRIPPGVTYDFKAAMARMRALRARISRVDSAERYRSLGVDVYLGHAKFLDRDHVAVEGEAGARTLAYVKAVICTGTRPSMPPVPGLADVGALTNETIFSLVEQPADLAVIGAGPIGCELAQAFARFGTRVTLIETEPGILPQEDRDAAELVQQALVRDGVTLRCGSERLTVAASSTGKRVTLRAHGQDYELAVDQILVAAGRTPNVERLGLEAVGVRTDRVGIAVNDRLQTSNPRIYAAGDVCSRYKFTHAADAMAQIVIQNALFPHPFGLGYASMRAVVLPWCTYTQPEIAHVGLYERQAKERGIELETYTYKLDEVDRAILDGEEDGFARLHIQRGTDRILGATIVAAHAGDLISQVSLLMKAGAGAKVVAGTVYPYPTQAEVLKKAVNLWRKAHFTARTKSWLTSLFAWMRR